MFIVAANISATPPPTATINITATMIAMVSSWNFPPERYPVHQQERIWVMPRQNAHVSTVSERIQGEKVEKFIMAVDYGHSVPPPVHCGRRFIIVPKFIMGGSIRC